MRTWKITDMKCKISENGLTNVVESINWMLCYEIEVNGQRYAQHIPGSTQLPTPNVEVFTNYEDLTQEQVESWITSNMSMDIEMMVTHADQTLIQRLTPTHVTLQPPF